jgi:hypothetical protein
VVTNATRGKLEVHLAEQRVRADRARVRNEFDRVGGDAGVEQRRDRCERACRGIARRRGNLPTHDRAARIVRDQIGERAADVDPHAHPANPSRLHAAPFSLEFLRRS